MRYILTGILLLSLLPLYTRGQTHQNLTTVLDKLSAEHGIRISFSPSLTDKVYPHNHNIKGNFKEALSRVLDGTNFIFKCVNRYHYYVIWQEPDPVIIKQLSIVHKKLLPVIVAFPARIERIPVPNIELTEGFLSLVSPPFIPEKERSIIAIKTNLLYDATSTLNWGIELGLNKRMSLDVSGNYNSWRFSNNRKMKHWLIQPEFRYWTRSRFSGHFFGLHAHYAQYNWGGMLPWGFRSGKMFGSVKNENIMNHRYEGWLLGGGLSYGYHWILGRRWGIEAEIGIGYAYLKYNKFKCESCGDKITESYKHYWGPTKTAINFIFMMK